MSAENKKNSDSASILLVSIVAIVAIVGVVIMFKVPMATSEDIVGKAADLQDSSNDDLYYSNYYEEISYSYEPECPDPSLIVDPTPTVSWNVRGGPAGSIDLDHTTITVNLNSKATCPKTNDLRNSASIGVVGKAKIIYGKRWIDPLTKKYERDELRTERKTINSITTIKKKKDVPVCIEQQNQMTVTFTGEDIKKAIENDILKENEASGQPKENLEVLGVQGVEIDVIDARSTLVRDPDGNCAGMSTYSLSKPFDGLKNNQISAVDGKPLNNIDSTLPIYFG